MSAADKLLVRVPPQDVEMERAILAACLLEPRAIDDVADLVEPSDFYSAANATIFAALRALKDAGDGVDLELLRQRLEADGTLGNVGGLAALGQLVDHVGTAANVERYASIVRDKSDLRAFIRASAEAQEEAATSTEDAQAIIDRCEGLIFDATARKRGKAAVRIGNVLSDLWESLQAGEKPRGIDSGFGDIDRLTGGFRPGEMTIIAARPSMGKTSLALSMMARMCDLGRKRALFFSLEMPQRQVTVNLLSNLARVDSHSLAAGKLGHEDEDRLINAGDRIDVMPIYIDDSPDVSTMQLRSKARRMHADKGLDVIFIDYLQLLTGSRGASREGRQQEVTEISRTLKALARELEVPLIALSQLSRKVEDRPDHKPRMSDLRESGCLTGDTLVTMADTGSRVPIIDVKPGAMVWAMGEDYRIGPAVVSNAWSTGVKPVYRLRLASGRAIRATANHRFRMLEGWRRLDELKQGDAIATPRALDQPGDASISEDELALLGHLIGDGCTLENRSPSYTTGKEHLADLVLGLARSVFGSDVRPIKAKSRTWWVVRVPATATPAEGRRSPIVLWLESLGLLGKRSHEKRVPDIVFEQPREHVATFLRHLWSTDGTIIKGRSAPAIRYPTSSPGLASDVQALLLRLGVLSTVRAVSQGSKGRTQHVVVVQGKADQVRFLEAVAPEHDPQAGEARLILEHHAGRKANTNLDVIPRSAWQVVVKPAMKRVGMTGRKLSRDIEMAYCGSSLYKSGIGRERALRVAAACQSDELARLATSDVYWDRVVSVEPDGEAETYDLTVPGPANFVAGDFVAHNSIEQDADLILLLYRQEYYERDNEAVKGIAEVIVAKNRNGPTGAVEMRFTPEFTRFDSFHG